MSGSVHFYIECFYWDGGQILGNLDGQAVIRTANYNRTAAYKAILKRVGNPNYMDAKVAFARVVRPDGQIVETIKPKRPLLHLFECNWEGECANGMVVVLAEDATEAKAICEGDTEMLCKGEKWSWQDTIHAHDPAPVRGVRYVTGNKGVVAGHGYRE